MSVSLIHGDSRAIIPTLEPGSVDSCCCDPPYALDSIVKRFGAENAAPAKAGKTGAFQRASAGFMNKKWDTGKEAFDPVFWRLVYGALKPGSYIVAFGGSRTYHRLATAIEDAGFITHPLIGWLFGSGFPKATRLKAPDTDHLRYGLQALKPALEPIYLGQKPMIGTGTANWLEHGTGSLNIDGCRIAHASANDLAVSLTKNPGRSDTVTSGVYGANRPQQQVNTAGRWPANVIHDGSDEVLEAFARHGESVSRKGEPRGSVEPGAGWGMTRTGAEYDDAGSPARFFYSAKADAEDRWGSKHPTVKPVDLMRWLVRLVTPPGGLVLDPFAGSGTTGVACLAEGMRCTMIEAEDEYAADIRERLAFYQGNARHSLDSKNRNRPAEQKGGAGTPLFGEVP